MQPNLVNLLVLPLGLRATRLHRALLDRVKPPLRAVCRRQDGGGESRSGNHVHGDARAHRRFVGRDRRICRSGVHRISAGRVAAAWGDIRRFRHRLCRRKSDDTYANPRAELGSPIRQARSGRVGRPIWPEHPRLRRPSALCDPRLGSSRRNRRIGPDGQRLRLPRGVRPRFVAAAGAGDSANDRWGVDSTPQGAVAARPVPRQSRPSPRPSTVRSRGHNG